ncbi:MAG: DUF4156 domain-containing protein [Bdellovibrio sp.]|nr:DUF4156 domain-containing protein [Bdellovibrio sp.]
MKYSYVLIILSTCFFGCGSTVSLTRAGQDINLITTSAIISKYRIIGEIECNSKWNKKSLITNIESCVNDLRNKAAEMGGASLLVVSQKLGEQNGFLCMNCVKMHALVIKSK